MSILIILGTSGMFSSGSWATLNYLKLLPTPKAITNSSPMPDLLNVDVRNQLPSNHKPEYKNNKLLRIDERKSESNNRLNDITDTSLKASNSRTNSIFNFNVQVPPKVLENSMIRFQHFDDFPLNV